MRISPGWAFHKPPSPAAPGKTFYGPVKDRVTFSARPALPPDAAFLLANMDKVQSVSQRMDPVKGRGNITFTLDGKPYQFRFLRQVVGVESPPKVETLADLSAEGGPQVPLEECQNETLVQALLAKANAQMAQDYGLNPENAESFFLDTVAEQMMNGQARVTLAPYQIPAATFKPSYDFGLPELSNTPFVFSKKAAHIALQDGTQVTLASDLANAGHWSERPIAYLELEKPGCPPQALPLWGKLQQDALSAVWFAAVQDVSLRQKMPPGKERDDFSSVMQDSLNACRERIAEARDAEKAKAL